MDKIKNELAQTDGFDNWEQMINCYCTTEPGRRMINDRINKVLKLCNSSLTLPCKRYDIDFAGNLLTGIELENNSLKIIGAMDGWGNGVDIERITITEK